MIPRLMTRFEKVLGGAAARSHRRPLPALAAAAVLVGLGGWAAMRLSLDTDLTELLPQSFESVQDLEKLKENFGGIGYVAVAGYDADPEQLRRFADEMAPKIEALPGIRFVEYERASTFFEERALYYLSLEDLRRGRAPDPGAREVRAPPEEPDVRQVRGRAGALARLLRTWRRNTAASPRAGCRATASAYYLDRQAAHGGAAGQARGQLHGPRLLAKRVVGEVDSVPGQPGPQALRARLQDPADRHLQEEGRPAGADRPRPLLGLDAWRWCCCSATCCSTSAAGGGGAEPGAGAGQPGLDLRPGGDGLRLGQPADRLPGGHPRRPGHRARHPPAGPLREPAGQGRELASRPRARPSPTPAARRSSPRWWRR